MSICIECVNCGYLSPEGIIWEHAIACGWKRIGNKYYCSKCANQEQRDKNANDVMVRVFDQIKNVDPVLAEELLSVLWGKDGWFMK
jgi:hypothetical protein